MKLEGGSNIKSPWYHRTGTRPVGATRQLTYYATGVGPHALTVRAQASVTSTLNIYIGNVLHYGIATAAGTGNATWGVAITFDSTTYGFSFGYGTTAGSGSYINQNMNAHLDEHLTVSGDTVYIVSIDNVGGSHAVSYSTALSMEYYGR